VPPADYGPHRTLIAPAPHADELRGALGDCVSWTVAGAQLTDLEALLAGFLSPCGGYGAGAVESEIAANVPCPALEISPTVAGSLLAGTTLALRDPEGVLLAGVRVSNVTEANSGWMVSGRVEGIELPTHHDFRHLRLTAAEIEKRLSAGGWQRALAFFPTRVMHAGTRAALMHLAAELNAAILVLVAASEAEHDQLAFDHRVRGLETSSAELPVERTVLVLIPINLPADPAERVLLERIVARNCGATHCAIDESSFPEGTWDPASVGFFGDSDGASGAAIVALRPWGFNRSRGILEDPEKATEPLEPAPSELVIISRLGSGSELPNWLFSGAELVRVREAFVPRHLQGFTVFFTGLSGSGKSTIAGALRVRLMELTGRPVTLLDGDLVRRHLSSELGFSREHRDRNILRIGWVAAEITRHGGIAVCAPIAPYDAVRKQVRAMVEATGGFVLVHVATSLETCERRDRKGLYARARAGLLPQFTGISDPYETPDDAALRIDTEHVSVDGACDEVVAWLRSAGYLAESVTT
jgi:sulfate adenylyltransferase